MCRCVSGTNWHTKSGLGAGLLSKEKKVQATQTSKDIRTSRPFVAVVAKSQYGQVRFYPANETADEVLRIQGGKTITHDSLKAVRNIGIEVSIIQEEVRL
jgi:hypothetical protein